MRTYPKPSGLVARGKRFLANCGGVAAVEFAYIAPVLMLALFGTLEVSRAVMMHKRFQRTSAMIGDLVARQQNVTAADLNGMMQAAQHVMYPYPVDTLSIEVNSLRALKTDANQTMAEWTYRSTKKTASQTCQKRSMPGTGMVTAGTTAIVVDARYVYKPTFAALIPGFGSTFIWSDTITHTPRQSCVQLNSAVCGSLCPTWQ